MRYTFTCDECGRSENVYESISVGPPESIPCMCGYADMRRDWKADAPMLDTSSCRDHDFVPHEKRVASNDGFGVGKRGAQRRVDKFQRHIQERRKKLADGGNRGSIKHTHSVPADLYHGKIRETGDRFYWHDPSNLKKHKSCKVD